MTLGFKPRVTYSILRSGTTNPQSLYPYPLLILIIYIQLTLFIKLSYASGSCEEDSRHCTCSMSETIEYLNGITVVSRSLLSREPEVVTKRISKFQCKKFTLLPDALVIKWNEIEDEYLTMIKRRRRRLKRSIKSRNPRSQIVINIPNLPPLKSLNVPFMNIPLEEFERESDDTDVASDGNNYYGSKSINDSERDQNHWRIGRGHSLQDGKRRRRNIAIGYPSNELFGEVIPRLPHRTSHQYVPLGAEAVLPCFGSEDSDEENPSLDKKFLWTHSNGKQVSASEMAIDKQSGELTLKSVKLSDSDIYNCYVTYSDEDSEESETITHLQQLDVVAEPIAWLKFSVIYTADSCDHDQLVIIQNHLVKWVHQYVCHFCPVRNHSVACVTNGNDGGGSPQEGGYRDVRIRLAVSTLGLEHRMTSFTGYSDACPLPCVETLHLKLLQIARNSLEKLFSLEIDLESAQEEKPSTFSSQPETLDADLAVGCPTGFFENYKLCFPCPAGQYSPNGNTECIKCPLGRYQPSPGSALCFPCPEGYGTAGEGSIAEFDCKTEFFISALNAASGSDWVSIMLIILAIFGPIILIICFIPYCCPNTTLGRWFACCSFCAPDPDEDPYASKGKRNSGNSAHYNNYTQMHNEDTEDEALGPVSETRRIFEEHQNGYSRSGQSQSKRTDFGAAGMGRDYYKVRNKRDVSSKQGRNVSKWKGTERDTTVLIETRDTFKNKTVEHSTSKPEETSFKSKADFFNQKIQSTANIQPSSRSQVQLDSKSKSKGVVQPNLNSGSVQAPKSDFRLEMEKSSKITNPAQVKSKDVSRPVPSPRPDLRFQNPVNSSKTTQPSPAKSKDLIRPKFGPVQAPRSDHDPLQNPSNSPKTTQKTQPLQVKSISAKTPKMSKLETEKKPRTKRSPALISEFTQTSHPNFKNVSNSHQKPELTKTSNSKYQATSERPINKPSNQAIHPLQHHKTVHFSPQGNKTKKPPLIDNRGYPSDSEESVAATRNQLKKTNKRHAPIFHKYRNQTREQGPPPPREDEVCLGRMHVKDIAKNLEEQRIPYKKPSQHLHRCLKPSASRIRQDRLGITSKSNRNFVAPPPPPMPSYR